MKKKVLLSQKTWNIILLATSVVVCFILPVFNPVYQPLLFRAGFTVLFISAVFSMDKIRWNLVIFSAIVTLGEWIGGELNMVVLTALSKFLNITFFFLIVGFIIRYLAKAKKVSYVVLMQSISGYLLIGISFTVIVAFIFQVDPGAFNITVDHPTAVDGGTSFSLPFYFTFVSQATLGYGDILPIKAYSRALATFITVAGQIYIAVLVAFLVGKFSASHGHFEES